MGKVTFIDRATGQPVLAEFPLHPGLVGYILPDGSERQLYRAEFDKQFGQQLPELPKINTTFVQPASADDPVLQLRKIATAAAAGASTDHETWFGRIWDEITTIRGKVDELLDAHPVLKASIERIERTVAQSHPTMQALEQAVSGLIEKKASDETPPPPPTGA